MKAKHTAQSIALKIDYLKSQVLSILLILHVKTYTMYSTLFDNSKYMLIHIQLHSNEYSKRLTKCGVVEGIYITVHNQSLLLAYWHFSFLSWYCKS